MYIIKSITEQFRRQFRRHFAHVYDTLNNIVYRVKRATNLVLIKHGIRLIGCQIVGTCYDFLQKVHF